VPEVAVQKQIALELVDVKAGGSQRDLLRNPSSAKLLFDHMPKAGGTFLRDLLKASVGRKAFYLLHEFEGPDKQQKDDFFIIGSIRNPCDYYVSLWAYGAEGHGRFKHRIAGGRKSQRVYRTKSKAKDSPKDVQAFRRWMRLISVPGAPGTLSIRLATSYSGVVGLAGLAGPPTEYGQAKLELVAKAVSDISPSSVDCWVRTETLVKDAKHCLEIYGNSTGKHVDWQAFQKVLKRGSAKSSTHGSCKAYFDKSTAALVRQGDGDIFHKFGYETCCGQGSSNWGSH